MRKSETTNKPPAIGKRTLKEDMSSCNAEKVKLNIVPIATRYTKMGSFIFPRYLNKIVKYRITNTTNTLRKTHTEGIVNFKPKPTQ